MTAKKHDLPKLVRDNYPELCPDNTYGSISTDDRLTYLNKKLVEEVNEYQETGRLEELADLVEVAHAILKLWNIEIPDFERVRKQKRKERGGYEKGVLLIALSPEYQQQIEEQKGCPMKIWEINLGIPFRENLDALAIGKRLETDLGLQSSAGGCGFGYRDLRFQFDADQGDAAKNAVKRICTWLTLHGYKVKEQVPGHPYETEDEDGGTLAYIGCSEIDYE